MTHIYEFDGVRPVVAEGAYVHPSAVLIGDVIIGPDCYIGPGASLRGDFGRIVIEAGANVQDNCVMHTFVDKEVRVEECGHIGHGAVLHGCVIKRNAIVGMNSVVMDGGIVHENAFVAAMAFVKSGFEVPAGTLVAGTPARVVRELSDQEIAWKTEATELYQELGRRCAQSMVAVELLREPEPGRGRRTPWPVQSSETMQERRKK